MKDVSEMLNYIYDENFMTHQLPAAMEKLIEVNPKWFKYGVWRLNTIKEKEATNDFDKLMELIDHKYENLEIELGKIDFH